MNDSSNTWLLSCLASICVVGMFACGGGTDGGDPPGDNKGASDPSTATCPKTTNAPDCTNATYGYPTTKTATMTADHRLLTRDGQPCTFLEADDFTKWGPGTKCADLYSCGGTEVYLSLRQDSFNNQWGLGGSTLLCSGGGGGGDECSRCLSACRGLSGCCTGVGCICESDC